jgi:DNA-binding NtrC family response regulator
VRELENTIERLVLTARGHEITSEDLQFGSAVEARPPRVEVQAKMFDELPTLDELERRYLMHVLEAVGGNRTRAAEALGIDRRTLYRMAERFGLVMPDAGGDPDRS